MSNAGNCIYQCFKIYLEVINQTLEIEIKVWVEEKLYVFDNKIIGDGLCLYKEES